MMTMYVPCLLTYESTMFKCSEITLKDVRHSWIWFDVVYTSIRGFIIAALLSVVITISLLYMYFLIPKTFYRSSWDFRSVVKNLVFLLYLLFFRINLLNLNTKLLRSITNNLSEFQLTSSSNFAKSILEFTWIKKIYTLLSIIVYWNHFAKFRIIRKCNIWQSSKSCQNLKVLFKSLY